jgi:transcriptional regulator with XRE-family HTH domain
MNHTQHYLDALKASNGGISDYRTSKKLNISRATVSLWKNGRTSMSMSQAEKVAEAIGADPDIVILETQLDRCKNPQEAAIWRRIIKRLTSTSIAAIIALLLFSPAPPAQSQPLHRNANDFYYVK